MGKVLSKDIRNVCLLGHSADGKTSVAEAMLYLTKGTDRLGNPTDGNTVCDYDAEEIKRGFSLSASLAPVSYKNAKINVIDTPGYLDFSGEVSQAIRVTGAALIVVNAKAGVEVGTEIAWDNVSSHHVPRAFFINKCDDPEARFGHVFTQLREMFGTTVCPITIPLLEGDTIVGLIDLLDMRAFGFGKGNAGKTIDIPAGNDDRIEKFRDMLLESIASTSEELMEKYFNGDEITREEAVSAIHEGVRTGTIAPVLCGSATNLCGIEPLMDFIIDTFPSPLFHKAEIVVDEDGTEHEAATSESGAPSIFVFKTIADPFVGKMSFFKVISGELKSGAELKNLTTDQTEKFAHIYTICGKKQTEVDSLSLGDIGMTAKLVNTNTNDTLTAGGTDKPFKKITYPESFYQRAIVSSGKGDEDKIGQGLARLMEEDPTLKYENNAETKQMLISGQGDIHLDVVVARLKSRFGVNVELGEPRVAYRETIRGRSDVQGKHKKQSGGHGQYGDVKIRFSPGEEEGLTFEVSVVGGTVPKNFNPAVEKGLLEAMQKGVLAGYPMVNLKADLYDGSYHPVDSSEMAFKIAASLAYKEGIAKANPVLLEPVANVKVYAPSDMIGDIMSAFTKRRGRVLGMTPTEKKGEQMLEAEAPIAEMSDFSIQLRAITQGRGKYTMKFERYEDVPQMVAEKIIAEAKKNAEEE
ncbi:MAG: elongation factor G [Clostridiales bacterium]|nr:elongation factor G [Clostridiales bacterium]